MTTMTSVPSTTVWGSPTATKHALLLHGATSSSHTWHRVASSLAAQGYLVTAPNLVGHAFRVSPDYHINSITKDLLPYLEARNYSLIIGHSLGAVTLLSLFPHLPRSYPTAIILVDPPMRLTPQLLDTVAGQFTDTGLEVKPAVTHAAENPLWTHEDGTYRELGTRLCSADALRRIFSQNQPWDFFSHFNAIPEKWKVTALLADPAIYKICTVEDIQPYPHIRSVVVPGAGHWIQSDFPQVIVEEALRRVAELGVA